MRIARDYVKFGMATALFLSISVVGSFLGSWNQVWKAEEVPIAFWAWTSMPPDTDELREVIRETKAGKIFIRAGQLDALGTRVERIRPSAGAMPTGIEIHLVYNATPQLLRGLKNIRPDAIAVAIAQAYRDDTARGIAGGAIIAGIQLDLDFPTRLLPLYAETLQQVRTSLPAGTILSITGLPTWVSSPELLPVLKVVDFWIPQLYGAEIPTRLSQPIPISSVAETRRSLIKIRELGQPFYAGLAAYGHAILYDKSGALVEIRGDLDPRSAENFDSLEVIGRGELGREPGPRDLRLAYRAKRDLVIDGLVISAGETLVFDMSTTASLRESTRVVREYAGSSLLGICIFRIPSTSDATNLGLREIVDAVRDRPTSSGIELSMERISSDKFILTAVNSGSLSSMASGALTIDMRVPSGSVRGAASVKGFKGFETLCVNSASETARECSSLRSNTIRISSNSWRPGDAPSLVLNTRSNLNHTVPMLVTTKTGDGAIEKNRKLVPISEAKP